MKLQLIFGLLTVWQVQGLKPLLNSIKPYESEKDARIIGGQVAYPGQFPYMADLHMSTNSFCGGSLISQTVVLTAGHCVEGSAYTDAYVGTHNLYDYSDPERAVYRSTATIMHEAYNWPFNDIALLIVPTVTLTSRIQTVRLPRYSDVGNTFVGALTTLSGWGQTSDGGSLATDLKYLSNVPVITTAECMAYYGSIVSTLLCTAFDNVNSGCLGDSGSPLVYTESDGQPTEIGLFALISSPSCLTGPGGFTRMTDYLDWINTNGGVPIRP